MATKQELEVQVMALTEENTKLKTDVQNLHDSLPELQALRNRVKQLELEAVSAKPAAMMVNGEQVEVLQITSAVDLVHQWRLKYVSDTDTVVVVKKA